ncbi:MAG: hypothetical protein J3K34DRAFT_460059 [Monoraphidium minutum]|nr:MAG: hypothetical protein J3K34DRAFT_460059 [Monoraphidium minutum]
MARRPARREPSVYDIHCSLNMPASETLLASLLCELLKHLQYSRGQSAMLVDRMEACYMAAAAAQAASKRKRMPSQLRRASKYMEQLASMLAALRGLPLRELLSARRGVALLLGPTPLRPREVYTIRFSAGGGGGGSGGGGGGGGEPGAREVASACKRLLRNLIVQGAAIEEWVDIAAATKMFVAVEAPAAQPAPAGFLPRRGFAPSLRRAFQARSLAGRTRADGQGVCCLAWSLG